MYSIPIANIELALDKELYSSKPILSAEDAVELLSQYLYKMSREVCCIINLDVSLHPINIMVMSYGSMAQTTVPIHEIIQGALLSNAKSIMLVHNHPHSHYTDKEIASQNDIQIANRLFKVCDLLDMNLLDSIIVCKDKKNKPTYYSLKTKKKASFHTGTLLDNAKRAYRLSKMDNNTKEYPPFDQKGASKEYWGWDIVEDAKRNIPHKIAYNDHELQSIMADIEGETGFENN